MVRPLCIGASPRHSDEHVTPELVPITPGSIRVMDQPHAGITPLMGAAAAAHELFVSLTSAGFTEEQALALVLGMMKADNMEGGDNGR